VIVCGTGGALFGDNAKQQSHELRHAVAVAVLQNAYREFNCDKSKKTVL
jgi:hypothetical protein